MPYPVQSNYPILVSSTQGFKELIFGKRTTYDIIRFDSGKFFVSSKLAVTSQVVGITKQTRSTLHFRWWPVRISILAVCQFLFVYDYATNKCVERNRYTAWG